MIRVLKDMVALRQLETLQSMSEVLYIPDTIEEGTRKCEVVAVGPGHTDEHGKFHPVDVNVGDLVFCARYAGQILKTTDRDTDVQNKCPPGACRGRQFLIVRCDDIIGVFPREV